MNASRYLLLGLAGCGAADRVVPEGAAVDEAPLGVLVVNEVAAAGDPGDWFEIVNASSQPVVLSDFVFVDLGGDLEKARPFPAGVTLAPGAFYVQDVTDTNNGFKLGGDEELAIYRACDGRLSDRIDWDSGASPARGSYARMPDVDGEFVTRLRDTRARPNQ